MSSPSDTSAPAGTAGKRDQRSPADAPAADDSAQRLAPAAYVPQSEDAPKDVKELQKEADLVSDRGVMRAAGGWAGGRRAVSCFRCLVGGDRK